MVAKTLESIPALTLGLDVGDRWTSTCLIDREGNTVAEGRVRTDPQPLAVHLKSMEGARVVLEVGQHSRWISELGKECGHDVIVANPATLKGLVRGRKTDRLDAAMLARLGRLDPSLLRPVQHRSRSVQAHRAVIKARDSIVRARTDLFNATRGLLKSFGVRPPSSTIPAFPKAIGRVIPEDLKDALDPLLSLQLQLTRLIREYDRRVEALCKERYPETERLRQVRGVGPLTSLHLSPSPKDLDAEGVKALEE